VLSLKRNTLFGDRLIIGSKNVGDRLYNSTRRPAPPASADRTARRRFQATGQPVSRTQASDVMASRLPRYEAKCVQRRCFQCGSVPLRSDIKGTQLSPANILIPHHSKGNWLRYNFAAKSFWATVCKTVGPILSVHCLSVLFVCNVGVLWPNGWTDQDETWHAGRPRPWPHPRGSRCHLVWS